MVISACGGKAQLCAGAMRKAHILVMRGSGHPLTAPCRLQLQSIEFPHASFPPRSGRLRELGGSQELVGLQRQAPLRMGQAIGDRRLGIGGALRIVHGLQEEMCEILVGKTLGRRTILRIDQFQFIAA